jgi:hypothetical protein
MNTHAQTEVKVTLKQFLEEVELLLNSFTAYRI